MTDVVPRSEATKNPDEGTAQTSKVTAAIRGPCVHVLHRFMAAREFEKEQKAWLRTGQNKASKTAWRVHRTPASSTIQPLPLIQTRLDS